MASPLKGSPLRAVRWKHPTGFAYPAVIELALRRVADSLARGRGAQWQALFGLAPTASGKERERRKRSDGATNVATVLSTLIASADLLRGLVATPAQTGWQRKTWQDIDTLAFGVPVPGERGMRRTERAAAELQKQGFVRSIPWRVITREGVRSVPGLKFVSDELWKALGVWSHVKSERRRRKQAAADERKTQLETSIGRVVRQPGQPAQLPRAAAAAAGVANASVPARPPDPAAASPPGPRAVSDVVAGEMAKLKAMFGD